MASVTDVFGSNTRDAGSWQISQSGGYTYVTCTSFGTSANPPIFVPYSQGTASNVGGVPDIWKVTIKNNQGDEIASQMLPPGVVTRYPEAVFSSSVLTVTDTYCVEVERRNYESVANPTSDMQKLQIYTVLTAPVTTAGGGGTNMFSWLNNDYWYLTDLQVNLGTRAVTHRHGTLELRPNDTVNFAVLFHDGSTGKDPVATDLRLAVRSASNASAYYFWANPSVTTTSVSGDIYYSITVTASDEDLLAAQAAGLLAGSNASQTLLAEVQWTTTRGTFTSDTFNITVANEVVREPDV